GHTIHARFCSRRWRHHDAAHHGAAGARTGQRRRHAALLADDRRAVDGTGPACAAGGSHRCAARAGRTQRAVVAGPRCLRLAATRAAQLVAGHWRGAGMRLRARRVMARPLPDDLQLPGDLPPLLRRIYAARRIRDGAELATELAAMLPVGTLAHVREAAVLLLRHRAGRVLIVGDFDADGATSTALMVHALRAWGFTGVDFLVPDRFRLGYGLTPGLVAQARQREPGLIVTVDNGICG